MKRVSHILILFFLISLSSCVSMKKYNALNEQYQNEIKVLEDDNETLLTTSRNCEVEVAKYQVSVALKDEQINELKSQIEDLKIYRDKQLEQVGDLTVLSQKANENIKQTLEQLEKKDDYITLLQNAKSKADSINLVLAVNLKSVLKDGIADEDIEIKVDKTVVFINLSDKMLFESGSYELTDEAGEVLEKIAAIVESKKDIEVMVEGYTDNVPISNSCIKDNWDLSVKRSTAVVRVLQTEYGVAPDKLIAAGRGEYNPLTDNFTAEGKATNRRTRIIILPKLDQFYDLLSPTNIPD